MWPWPAGTQGKTIPKAGYCLAPKKKALKHTKVATLSRSIKWFLPQDGQLRVSYRGKRATTFKSPKNTSRAQIYETRTYIRTYIHDTTKQNRTLHCIALCCVSLPCIALSYITLRCTHTIQQSHELHTLHYIATHDKTLHSTTVNCIALHCTIFCCITLRYVTLHYITLHTLHAFQKLHAQHTKHKSYYFTNKTYKTYKPYIHTYIT